MAKVQCKNGHKWYTEYGHNICPRCGQAPLPYKDPDELEHTLDTIRKELAKEVADKIARRGPVHNG